MRKILITFMILFFTFWIIILQEHYYDKYGKVEIKCSPLKEG